MRRCSTAVAHDATTQLHRALPRIAIGATFRAMPKVFVYALTLPRRACTIESALRFRGTARLSAIARLRQAQHEESSRRLANIEVADGAPFWLAFELTRNSTMIRWVLGGYREQSLEVTVEHDGRPHGRA